MLGGAGCSPLAVLNGITPGDGTTRLAVQNVAYGSDRRQRLDLHVPSRLQGRAPVLVFIYGGSWNSGSKDDYAFIGRAFAAQGFVTAVIDYRLVPQVRFPDFVDDAARAVRWVQDNIASYGGDPGRIYLLGHSAGAYNATMLALDRRYLARAGVRDGAVKKVAALAGPYDFLPLRARVIVNAFGAWPKLPETQPASFVRASAPRMLLASGADDTTVYPSNTQNLAKQLRSAGARVDEKIYPGVGHAGILLALSAPFRASAPVLADVIEFFRAP